MAPKAAVTVERLHAAAHRSVIAETSTLASENRDIVLACHFLGIADASGALAADVQPRSRANGLFEWTAAAVDLREASNVAVQCCHALKEDRTIPLPDAWRFALRCRTLETIAAKSARELAARTGLEQVACRVLGVAKPAAAPNTAAEPKIGASRALHVTSSFM